MAEKLRPCPFCGGEAKAFYDEAGGVYEVQCQECGAEPYIGYRRGAPGMRTLGDVIKAWNRRAERTCRNASLDPECFKCSECGAEDYTSDSLTMWHEGGPVDICCCPVCGARIVEEAGDDRR